MKTALVIIGFICFGFSVKKNGEAVYGIWQGAYGVNDRIEDAWVVFGPSNMVEFYEGNLRSGKKITGTYNLLGDTAIVFTCTKSNGMLMKMEGNLNRTKNFVDGSWQSSDDDYGSFFLQKQK